MLNKISLKRRLWLSLVLLWTVILLCTVVGIKGLLDTQKSLRLIHEDRMGTMSLLQDITANFDDTRSSVFRAFQHDPNHDLHLLHNHGVRQHTDTIRENRKHNIGFRERLNNRQVNEFEAELRSSVFTALNAWRDQLDAVVEGIDRNEYSNRLMLLFLTTMDNEGLEVQNSIKKLSNYQIDQANEASSFAQRQLNVSLFFFALLYAFLALPATFFMILSLHRLNHGLGEVENAVNSITVGDLTYSITLSGNDEMTHVKRKVMDMQLSLTKLISGIREGSDKIETDIVNLSNFSRELVDRNITQSASLEQTSAATEELNGTVEHNAENARQAEETSQEANHAAIRGGEAVKGVVAIMGEINKSSEHISNIVSIIDSIAFQTNILALNAAVEAARAGEQGRGFAVVASEVRALAQRSASAAGDIKKLVEESIQVVNSGSQQVNNTGDMMRDIVESNAKLTTLIGEISSASAEQVIGLGQINQAMMQMDRSNHENNELATNTDEITRNLSEQSQHLMELVATFRLTGDYEH